MPSVPFGPGNNSFKRGALTLGVKAVTREIVLNALVKIHVPPGTPVTMPKCYEGRDSERFTDVWLA